MLETDRLKFSQLIADVYLFYRRGRETGEVSEFDLYVWWTSMRPYDLEAVVDALGRHSMNPDTGQFRPMPADVVKMLGGSTLDSALVALSKVEAAMQSAGTYRTLVFDDAIIHRVVDEMGGWVAICSSKDWTFRRKEFENRYRGYKMAGRVPDYPSMLIGIADGENAARGVSGDDNLVLVGNEAEARRVLTGGTTAARVALTPASKLLSGALKRLESKP